MNIEYPTPAGIPQLKTLWKTAFADEDAFLDKFFTIAFSPDRCRCAVENGTIAAALYWFETACGGQRFAYIYAVATDPQYRGRGLCRALMADTARILAEQGYHGALLNPADEGLARMYEKMGYKPCTTVTEFTRGPGTPISLRKVEPSEFARLRRTYLPKNGVIQEKEDLALLASMAEFYAGSDLLAAVTMDGPKLHCHELLGNVTAAPGIVAALGAETGFFRIPGPEKEFVFLLKLQKNCMKPGYFAFVLD